MTVLVRDLSLTSQRRVLAPITVRAKIGFHGIRAGIVGGGFCGSVHGSKLALLILDLVLQFLDQAELAARLRTALGRSLPPCLFLAISTSLSNRGLFVLVESRRMSQLFRATRWSCQRGSSMDYVCTTTFALTRTLAWAGRCFGGLPAAVGRLTRCQS